jgi:hypothetical protein
MLAGKDIYCRRSPKNLTMAQASRLSIQEAELKKENDYLKMRIEQLTEQQNHANYQKLQSQNRLIKAKIQEMEQVQEELVQENQNQLNNFQKAT